MTQTYIVTPNYGTEFLKTYFESLSNQVHSDFKIIIIDNTESYAAVNYINNMQDKIRLKVKLVHNNTNSKFAKAMNQGIVLALQDPECEYVIALNNDIRAHPDFIQELVNCAVRHPDAGSIQSLMLYGDSLKIDNTGLLYSRNGLGFARNGYEIYSSEHDEETEILGCCAGACLYKATSLLHIQDDAKQYFDETLEAYYDDVDVALRLQWLGYKAYYAPKAIVNHYKNISPSDQKTYYAARNSKLTMVKNMPLGFRIINFPFIFTAELAQIAINLVKGRPIVLKAKLDAWKIILSRKLKYVPKEVPTKNITKFMKLQWRP